MVAAASDKGEPDEEKGLLQELAEARVTQTLKKFDALLHEHARRLAQLEQVRREVVVLRPAPLISEDLQAEHCLSAGDSGHITLSSSPPQNRENLPSLLLQPVPPVLQGIPEVISAYATGKVEEDPFRHMWSHAKIDQQEMFDQALLQSIYQRPYQKARTRACLLGGFVLGILSMPFGPIGMAVGFSVGALVGGLIGFCIDKRRERGHIQLSELEQRRLKSLVRWAAERIEDENQEEERRFMEMVILEFKPMADIASGSKNARKLLKLLDSYVCSDRVMRQLWVYLDSVLHSIRNTNREDFLRSMLVLQTLLVTYQTTSRILYKQEATFVARIERLLSNKSVKLVMSQRNLSGQDMGLEQRMSSMVFADAFLAAASPGAQSSALQDFAGVVHEDLETDNVVVTIGGGRDHASPLASRTGTKDQNEGSGYRTPQLPSQAQQPVLKTPFFKSWEDFMEFDTTYKRKIPITQSDFTLLLEKEASGRTNEGWEVCINRSDLKVSKAAGGDASTGCVTLGAWATIPGADMYVAFNMFYKCENRMQWDKTFHNMYTLPKDAQGSEILYSLMKILTFTPRDYVQYRRVRVEEDGSIIIVMRSAEHPDLPEKAGNIRAESFISGYTFRDASEGGEKATQLFLMSCTDVKGYIPKWLINIVAPKKPGEWIEQLRKACLDYQVAHPNCKEEMQQVLKPFTLPNPFDYEDPSDATLAQADATKLFLEEDQDDARRVTMNL